jgi:bifunctional non-homologous end joining protein LigD
VKFTEWTSAAEMRHPAFLGLREDKNATDVVLEKEARRST